MPPKARGDQEPVAEFQIVKEAKSFPVPECRRVKVALANGTKGLVGVHFVTYEGKEQPECILWLKAGQRKEVEWSLGWVVRVRDHATKVSRPRRTEPRPRPRRAWQERRSVPGPEPLVFPPPTRTSRSSRRRL